MNTASRLGLYSAGLLAIFGISFALAKPLVPADVVARWTASDDRHTGHDAPAPIAATDLMGLSTAAGGYVLSPVSAPTTIATAGTLSFRIDDASHKPLTSYATAHDKQLHLIVVRSDGSGYRHVHPRLDAATGTWSIPWTWPAAGTYRVFADFTPSSAATSVTLSRTVDVVGELRPQAPAGPITTSTVDGYTATLSGTLNAGTSSDLRVTITHDGAAVTALEPYLGAFGHLVALRQGDLAYLHVHAMGGEPKPDDRSGPTIDFMASVPSVGRYLLYLDFQVDGAVRTATFVLDAGTTSTPPTATAPDHDTHGGH
ncbi:heavy-metal-associated domain-containing protein [Gordonia sp. TBRC 11910]|uniref:Heavy-metal-associated domain-containing protein n=1 Tax=Gordonia asplenii TaxID=2725283 RepID=A0A848KUD8_9ACTN|nr:heavy-metal-associated domain-containing protein [Gordonia asplenii]NMO01617.1 heavy-metal-associated domain-containing protein [Gordonia asplenii]